MNEHKIQSKDNKILKLELESVPKVLGCLSNALDTNKTVVSFKLETDNEMLEKKVIQSFEKYNMDYVIGNLLESIRRQVIIYKNDKEYSQKRIERKSDDCVEYLEMQIVQFIMNINDSYN